MKIRENLKWLDPFTYVDLFVLPKVKALSPALQWAIFAASYFILLALIYLIVGVSLGFFFILTAAYLILLLFYKEEAIDWAVYALSAFGSAWVIYTAFGLLLGTTAPMVIVVSGSMEPLYHRGDVIVLQGASFNSLQGQEISIEESLAGKPFSSFASPVYSNGSIQSIEFNNGQSLEITQEGSIIVYYSTLLQEPIIHRVVAKIVAEDGGFILTKGDSVNNKTIDQDCGKVIYGNPEKPCIALYPITMKEIQGRAALQIPLVGCVKLWAIDNLSSLLITGKLPEHFAGVC